MVPQNVAESFIDHIWYEDDIIFHVRITVVSPHCSLEAAPYFNTEAAVAWCFWYFSCTVHSNGTVNDGEQLLPVQNSHCQHMCVCVWWF